MIFSGSSSRSSSNVFAPSSSARIQKTNSPDDHNEVKDLSQTSKLLGRKSASTRLQIQARGPICKSRRKVGSSGLSSQEKDVEEGDLAKKFAEEVCSDDDDTSSWLSTGISSPSSCFDDQIFRNLLDSSLDDWLVSLSMLSTNACPRLSRTKTFFDGSRVNPLEEAAFFLQRGSCREEIFQENSLSEKEITAWLMDSVEVEDELSQNWKIQKMGFFGSLIDLDGENSEWISDTDLMFLQIDFPSPSCKSSWSFESQSSAASSDVSSLIESEQKENEIISTAAYAAEDEHNELTDYRADEPLYWSGDMKFDSGSEFSWDFLIMSPRKNVNLENRR